MSKFEVRGILPSDAKNYVKWLQDAEKITSVDKEVYGYPALISLVVDKDGEPIIMTSFHPVLAISAQFVTQTVLMVEALAVRPGARSSDIVRALVELQNGIRNVARNFGYKEIWFQSAAPRFQRLVTRHHFALAGTMMKRKVNFPDQPIREVWHVVLNEDHQKFLEQQDFKLAVMPVYRGMVHA